MKKYVVFLLVFVSLLAFQTSHALAGGFGRSGFASRDFVVGSRGHRFASPSFIVLNPGNRVVRFNPFAHEFVVAPQPFVGNTVIIDEPLFSFGHGIGLIREALFFDHLHQFHGLALRSFRTSSLVAALKFFLW